MERIVLDADMLAKLKNLSEPLELCDQAGNVVGNVYPAGDATKWEAWEPPYDEEELRRREQSIERRYSTTEVLEYLRKL